MKKFLTILLGFLIVLGIAFGFIYYFFLRNNCHLPVGYTIGQVDSRFKISSSTVLKSAEDAANRWSSETQENLFKYDPNAKLKINLIYDSRQADLDKLNAEIQGLSNQRQSVEGSLQQYQDLLAAYQKDLASYNQTVNFWNSRGGAPPAIYSSFNKKKQSSIKKEVT